MAKVQDIKAGFQTPWYLVVKDAERAGPSVTLTVRYPDGGQGTREFDYDTELEGELPISYSDVVEMGNPPQYGWECGLCQSSSGLDFGTRYFAVRALRKHEDDEHDGERGPWEEINA